MSTETASGSFAHSVLAEAAGIVQGARNATHGDKERSFQAIADLWNAYMTNRKTGGVITPRDVAAFMVLLKLGRSIQGTAVRDHFVDAAGYAAIAGELADSEPVAAVAPWQAPATPKRSLLDQARDAARSKPIDFVRAFLKSRGVDKMTKLSDASLRAFIYEARRPDPEPEPVVYAADQVMPRYADDRSTFNCRVNQAWNNDLNDKRPWVEVDRLASQRWFSQPVADPEPVVYAADQVMPVAPESRDDFIARVELAGSRDTSDCRPWLEVYAAASTRWDQRAPAGYAADRVQPEYPESFMAFIIRVNKVWNEDATDGRPWNIVHALAGQRCLNDPQPSQHDHFAHRFGRPS
jgi:hypothetical protein